MPANEFATHTRRANTVEVGEVCLADMALAWNTAMQRQEESWVEGTPDERGYAVGEYLVLCESELPRVIAEIFPGFNQAQCAELASLISDFGNALKAYLEP